VSNVVVTPRDQASLVSAINAAAGGRITLGLKIDLAPGWHVYWSNPGDAGLAPQVALAAPAMAGAFTYPPPEFLLQGDVAAFVLSGHVLLPFAATGVGSSVTATASWLVCRDICVPEHAAFTLALPGGVSAFGGGIAVCGHDCAGWSVELDGADGGAGRERAVFSRCAGGNCESGAASPWVHGHGDDVETGFGARVSGGGQAAGCVGADRSTGDDAGVEN
jgi:hypothetical protein